MAHVQARLFFLVIVATAAVVATPTNQGVLPENCGSTAHNNPAVDHKAELGEFPWMVRLKYEKNGKELYACDGFIIHDKFVLTSAICVTNKQAGVLTKIVLGEYNTETNPDCEKKVCAPDIQLADIASSFVHPDFKDKENDIALIKLKDAIKFNDYVAPICLTDSTAVKNAGSYSISGWGKSPAGERSSKIKQKISEPLADLEKCKEFYKKKNVALTSGHLCAAGEFTCAGLSGDPLMYLSNNKWYAAGIASFGVSACAGADVPSVYTDILNYEDWIVKTIKENL